LIITKSILTWLLLFIIIGFIIYLHFYYRIPGVDAGIHLYGSFLLTKGHLPYKDLWNNKPPLIYVIGTFGFLIRNNPFLGERIIEIICFLFSLFVAYKILRLLNLNKTAWYLLSFSTIYLLCWDQGFLTEEFTVPLNLVCAYAFLKRLKFFEIISVLLLFSTFLLKQNACIFILSIISVDIFHSYRTAHQRAKLATYFVSTFVVLLLLFISLWQLGIWNDFIDQVFIYNAEYSENTSLIQILSNHFFNNSFLSVKGISIVLLFNLFIIILLIEKRNKLNTDKGLITIDKSLFFCGSVYIISYIFVYINGKSYPHYFMLLIVPFAMILGYVAQKFWLGKFLVVGLVLWGFLLNSKALHFHQPENMVDQQALVNYIKANITPNEYIHVAGFGNQYIYAATEQMSNSKFILPLFENNGYSLKYRTILQNDFKTRPPFYLIFNKISYRQLNPQNFYTTVINAALNNYYMVFENKLYTVYKRKQ
jgi:hypothetical protein